MKYVLKVFKGCDTRYIPVSPENFDKYSANCYSKGNTYYKAVSLYELDSDLQRFVKYFF